MNCTEFEDMIPELLEGELSGEDRAKALEHVKECNECDEMYKKLMSIRGELGAELKIPDVEEFIRTLEPIDKKILAIRYNCSEITFKDISEILSMNISTVKKRYYAIYKKYNDFRDKKRVSNF